MTEWSVSITLLVPISEANREWLNRLGVALFTPGLKPADRLKIMEQGGYDPADPEASNFKLIYNDGNKEFYVGFFQLKQDMWDRLQSRLVSAPAGCKYIKKTLSGDEYKVDESNIQAIQNNVKTHSVVLLIEQGLKEGRK